MAYMANVKSVIIIGLNVKINKSRNVLK